MKLSSKKIKQRVIKFIKMKIDLTQKIALVSGGGTGIGRYIVKALSDAGAKVAFTSRNQKSINGTLKILKNPKIHKGYRIDISKKNNVKKLYKLFKKDFGTIDILINNIGHTLNKKDPFSKIEDWRSVMNLNFFTSVDMVNNFIPEMKKNWGRIINIFCCWYG